MQWVTEKAQRSGGRLNVSASACTNDAEGSDIGASGVEVGRVGGGFAGAGAGIGCVWCVEGRRGERVIELSLGDVSRWVGFGWGIYTLGTKNAVVMAGEMPFRR